jgi:putative endonuclease
LFIYCFASDNSYYTVVTNDLDRRLYEHENGIDPRSYTFKRRPVKLVFQERFTEITQAIAFEKQVKDWKRAKKEAIINGEWNLLPELSKRNNNLKNVVKAFARMLRVPQHAMSLS